MYDALIVLRTPLQAFLARLVIAQEGIVEYDLIYLTQQDSKEDRYYFSKLSSGARLHRYIFVAPKRVDIFNHLNFRYLLRDCFKDFGRDFVLIGSIDAPVITSLTSRQKTSDLITVDDGSANINRESSYHVLYKSWRAKIYAKLLGAVKLSDLVVNIQRHYTIFNGVKNIVEEDKLRYLPSICPAVHTGAGGGIRRYFIGQPVPNVYRNRTTMAIKKALGQERIDYYVQHPREETPLQLGAPCLDKRGRIAEEAILLDAEGCDVHIFSGFSTATLNLSSFVQSTCIFLYPEIDDYKAAEMKRVAELIGCKVFRL